LELLVELVEGKTAAEVQAGKTGFDIGPHQFQQWNKPCRIDSARSINPVNHLTGGQSVRHPMFGDSSHAFTAPSRPA
tara:strand:- start:244 stop:474 length:231 start_codon:yes stop_codon:yes gene_type:complete